MKTISLTAEEMERRIARRADLKPIEAQRQPRYPQEVMDLLYARKLLPVIGLDDRDTALSDSAPIVGAAGMTITYAICPPGQGPGLHAHRETFETFTVMRGRFAFFWGDAGDQQAILEELDVISVPPLVSRAFRNVGDAEGILQVIITGGTHDKNDIDLAPAVAEEIARIDPRARDEIERTMFSFTAGCG